MEFNIQQSLQTHLINAAHRTTSNITCLGNLAQLSSAINIFHASKINDSFSNNQPKNYPELPAHQYLIACIPQEDEIKVLAIYNLKQIFEVYKKVGQNKIEWRIFEIPTKVMAALQQQPISKL